MSELRFEELIRTYHEPWTARFYAKNEEAELPNGTLVASNKDQDSTQLPGSYTTSSTDWRPVGGGVGGSSADEVIDFPSLVDFPTTGQSGIIYIALNTNKQYRWSGSGYALLSDSGLTVNQLDAISKAENPSIYNEFITNSRAITLLNTRVPKSAAIINRGGTPIYCLTWQELLSKQADGDIIELIGLGNLNTLFLKSAIYYTGGRPLSIGSITDAGQTVNAKILGGSPRAGTTRYLNLSGVDTKLTIEMDLFPYENNGSTISLYNNVEVKHKANFLGAWGQTTTKILADTRMSAITLLDSAKYYGDITSTNFGASCIVDGRGNSYGELKIGTSEGGGAYSEAVYLRENAVFKLTGGAIVYVSQSQNGCLAELKGNSKLHLHSGVYGVLTNNSSPVRLLEASQVLIHSDATLLEGPKPVQYTGNSYQFIGSVVTSPGNGEGISNAKVYLYEGGIVGAIDSPIEKITLSREVVTSGGTGIGDNSITENKLADSLRDKVLTTNLHIRTESGKRVAIIEIYNYITVINPKLFDNTSDVVFQLNTRASVTDTWTPGTPSNLSQINTAISQLTQSQLTIGQELEIKTVPVNTNNISRVVIPIR